MDWIKNMQARIDLAAAVMELPEVRMIAAEQLKNPQLLCLLAGDIDSKVRVKVAQNRYLPEVIRDMMAEGDPDPRVKRAAKRAKNPLIRRRRVIIPIDSN